MGDDALAVAVGADATTAPLAPRERALVAYAVALTVDPGGPSAERMADLRSVGFDDAAILTATEVVAYFNFVNRLASGLGVALEEGHE